MFENEEDIKVHTGYYLPKVKIKNYNVKIDGKNLFDQLVKSDMKTYITFKKLQQVKEMITLLVVY